MDYLQPELFWCILGWGLNVFCVALMCFLVFHPFLARKILLQLMELMERNAGVFIDHATDPMPVSSKTVLQEETAKRNLQREEIEKIQKRLDDCYHFIDTDSQRCKMELKNLMIMVSELLESSI